MRTPVTTQLPSPQGLGAARALAPGKSTTVWGGKSPCDTPATADASEQADFPHRQQLPSTTGKQKAPRPSTVPRLTRWKHRQIISASQKTRRLRKRPDLNSPPGLAPGLGECPPKTAHLLLLHGGVGLNHAEVPGSHHQRQRDYVGVEHEAPPPSEVPPARITGSEKHPLQRPQLHLRGRAAAEVVPPSSQLRSPRRCCDPDLAGHLNCISPECLSWLSAKARKCPAAHSAPAAPARAVLQLRDRCGPRPNPVTNCSKLRRTQTAARLATAATVSPPSAAEKEPPPRKEEGAIVAPPGVAPSCATARGVIVAPPGGARPRATGRGLILLPFTIATAKGGAASQLLPEIAPIFERHISLCNGQVLEMTPSVRAHTAPRSLQAACGDPQVRAKRNGQGAPSLLGPTYIAAHGPSRLVIGSRKQWGVAAATALNSGESEEEARSAAAELLPKAEALCPALNANWQVERVRSGVRAVPPRTPKGALPLVGLVQGVWGSSEATGDGAESRVWMHVGLGARGLVYHAWIARHLSKAMVTGDVGQIPWELRALLEGDCSATRL
ncbi:hypothetical protein CYMTET_3108 [Cymbomonas tetramitiformis]|uniref:Uncharacterized protein n=1 Tax=Cymbomonas tetramitiformis TaxID=36881 RepID=A0AAE0H408_9CHLO|nr:hypothetical protein CYMTET_3108 [Cymbomonas tetramitiformis]